MLPIIQDLAPPTRGFWPQEPKDLGGYGVADVARDRSWPIAGFAEYAVQSVYRSTSALGKLARIQGTTFIEESFEKLTADTETKAPFRPE